MAKRQPKADGTELRPPRRRGAVWIASGCCALTLVVGCAGGGADTPDEGEGTDVNADMGSDGSTSGDVSDSNSGANSEGPGPDSDAGEDDGGQGSPPAPAST